MTGRERNMLRARRWLRFMRLGGKRAGGDLLREHRSRYFREAGGTIHVYIPMVER
jgi:hypothetical protein